MKKKICIIASSPSGIVSFWKTNIEKISEEFDIYIIAKYENPKVFEGLKIKGYKYINICRRPTIISNFQAIKELTKYFKKEHFDGFISMSSNASLIASIAGKIAKIPFRARIFTGQIWAIRGGLFRIFFKTIDRFTVAMNTHILVDGKSQQNFLIKHGILKEGQSTVLANGSICGVDINKFKPDINIRKEERYKMNFTENDFVYTFMGRMNKDKGTYELLSAFDIIAKKFKNTKLMLIGNNEGIDLNTFSLYKYIEFNKNLVCYGFTKTPYHALQAGDVFCLPSYREGFGMSVIEASALEMPVIASDAYGLQDSFVDGVTGKKCKVMDVETLYKAMEELYLNKSKCLKFGKAGRERIVNMFSMEIVSNAWLKYLIENV